MAAIDIFLSKGKRGLILEKDWLTREEKDQVRERFGPEGSAGVWFLEMPQDEPEGDFDEEHADDERVKDGGEPTAEDLDSMTVAQLKELAAKEQVDISGLTLKADLIGRMCAHFGVEPSV